MGVLAGWDDEPGGVLLGADDDQRAFVKLAFLVLRTAIGLIQPSNALVSPCTAVRCSTERACKDAVRKKRSKSRVRLDCSATSFAPPSGSSSGGPDVDRCCGSSEAGTCQWPLLHGQLSKVLASQSVDECAPERRPGIQRFGGEFLVAED